MAKLTFKVVMQAIKDENNAITQKNVAECLGYNKAYLSTAIKNEKTISNAQIEKIRQCLDLKLNSIYYDRIIIINYIDIPQLEVLIKHPKIPDVIMDKNIVVNVWNKDPDKIKLCKNNGNTMLSAKEITIRHNDVLFIDTSIDYYAGAGIYCFTTRDDTQLYNAGLLKKPDGSIKLYFWNKTFETIKYSEEDWLKLKPKIYGQIIKNISLGTYSIPTGI